jgi:ERCC4-related helicase
MAFISNPQIAPDVIEERAYQVSMAKGCMNGNTLLILPTGLGKTVVAVIVAANVLSSGKKVVVLAPTKPLVEQHFDTFTADLPDTKVGTMNGNMPPSKRAYVFGLNDMIVTTPQVVENDLENNMYDLADVGLVVYDEAHRAVGNYAYVTVAKHYRGLVLGMTASPGSDPNKMREVCDNLNIQRVDMRTEDDPDVSPYVHDIFINRIEVNMPDDLTRIISLLNKLMDPYVDDLVRMGLMDPNWPASTKHLLVVGDILQKRLARGEKTAFIFRGLTCQAVCVKLLHAIGLAETQGMSALRAYVNKLDEDAMKKKGSKGTKELMSTPEWKEVQHILLTSKVEHPKISRVMSLVSMAVNSDRNTRVMVFSQYRDTCEMLVEKLSHIDGVRVAKLIGQANGGLKQKEQIELLDDFRSGKYNTIVSTSVGEEGLDVTSTDMVIFYEPVPSEIRTIQRRGRTGRKNNGEVYVLIAKGTRDEVFESASKKKEELMHTRLEKLNGDLGKRPPTTIRGQTKIGEF